MIIDAFIAMSFGRRGRYGGMLGGVIFVVHDVSEPGAKMGDGVPGLLIAGGQILQSLVWVNGDVLLWM